MAVGIALTLFAAACDHGEDEADDTTAEDTAEEEISDLTVDVAEEKPAAPEPIDLVLRAEDLRGDWRTKFQPAVKSSQQFTDALVMPCGGAAPTLGEDGAANTQINWMDGVDFFFWHSISQQSSDEASSFFQQSLNAASSCDDEWPRTVDGTTYTLSMVDGPQSLMRGDETTVFTLRWEQSDESLWSTQTIIQTRCGVNVSRLSFHHSETFTDSSVIDDIAELAFTKLADETESSCSLALTDWLRDRRSIWTADFAPLSLRSMELDERPSLINAIHGIRVQKLAQAPTLEDFLDFDGDGEAEPEDLIALVAMWLVFPRQLAASAPLDLRNAILGARELIDLNPVVGCISAATHAWDLLHGTDDFDALKLAGCGLAAITKVASGLRTLDAMATSRWTTALNKSIELGEAAEEALTAVPVVKGLDLAMSPRLRYAGCPTGQIGLPNVDGEVLCFVPHSR